MTIDMGAVLEGLKEGQHPRTQKSLDQLNDILKTYHDAGHRDFSVTAIGRVSASHKGLVQPSSNIRTASHLQWSAFVSPLKRLGHFLIEEVYKLMKPCFKAFC